MINLLKQIAVFVLLIFIQLFILNNLILGFEFGYLFQPQIIVFFLLLLPVSYTHVQQILLAFFSGLLVDFFFNSWGIHAAVSTLIGFFRYYVVLDVDSAISGRDEDNKAWTSKKSKTWKWFYFLGFTTIYHFFFILKESLGRNFFTYVLPSVIVSSLFTFLLILILENLLYKPARN
jgi:hypothetical protein